MPEKNQSCSNCYFFFPTGENEEGKIGYCRCNPPAPVTENGKIKIGRFPIVLGQMWCGAWDGKDEE